MNKLLDQDKKKDKRNFVYAVLLISIGLSAIVLQFYFAIIFWTERGMTLPGASGQFFSYYTILTITCACLCLFAALNKKDSTVRKLFLRKNVFAPVTISVIFISIAFNTLLRGAYSPSGLERAVNEVMHLIFPIGYLFFYSMFRSNEILKWKSVFYWQVFPVIYVIIIFFRGQITQLYPYPFIDVPVIGLSTALMNALFLLCGFLLLSLLFAFFEIKLVKNRN